MNSYLYLIFVIVTLIMCWRSLKITEPRRYDYQEITHWLSIWWLFN